MAADSVAEILLRIRSDAAQAKRELFATAKQVQQFDNVEGEATADVDAGPAKRKLKDLFSDLFRFSRERAVAHAEVDVDADRALQGLSGFRDKFRGVATDIRATATNLTALLIPAVIGLAGSLAPAVTVMASAAVGLGALGVAALAAGAAFGALAAGAVLRFKEQASEAGTAANELKRSFKDLKGAFKDATAGGADRVFAGLSTVLQTITPQVRGLQGAFTLLGSRVGGALSGVAPQIGQLVAQFGHVITAAAPLGSVVVTALVALARIILNIAQAAMPMLVRGAAAVSVQLTKWSLATRDIGALRGVLGGMVGDFSRLFRLGVALGRAVIPLFTALHSSGRTVVKDLTDLANRFAKWARTAEGQKQLATFFSQSFTSVKDLGNALAAAAPLAAGFMQSFGGIQSIVLRGVTGLLNQINKLPAGLQGAAVAVGGFGAAAVQLGPGILMMTRLRNIEAALTGATNLSTLAMIRQKAATVASAAASRVAAAAQWLWNAALAANPITLIVIAIIALVAALVLAYTKIGWFRDGVNAAFNAIKAVVGAVAGAIGDAASAVAGVIADIASGIVSGIRSAVSGTINAASAIGHGIASGIESVAKAIWGVVRSIVGRVVAIIKGYIDAYRRVGTAIFNAVKNGITSVAGAIRDAARSIIERVVVIVRGFIDRARSAGTAVFRAVWDGIRSVAGSIRDTVRGIVQRVIDIVQSFLGEARVVGANLMTSVHNGIVSLARTIYRHAREILTNTLQVIKDLGTAFFNAGKSLITSLVNGIKNAAQTAIDTAKDLAKKIRDILPFSEPKDPSSPFRGLGKSGEAIVMNLTAGVARAGPMLAAALTDAAAGISLRASAPAVAGAPALSLSDGVLRALASRPGAAGATHVHVTVESLHPADSKTLDAISRTVTDSLSRQAYRERKLTVIP